MQEDERVWNEFSNDIGDYAYEYIMERGTKSINVNEFMHYFEQTKV